MISILTDPSFAKGVWCTSLVESLTAQLKQKRIAYREIDGPAALDGSCRYAFIVGADDGWVQAALAGVHRMGVYPILVCNESHHGFHFNYSTVCSDVLGSMRYLLDGLRARNRPRVALFGINPHSIADQSRMDGYLSAVAPEAPHVYYNDGALRRCYEQFMSDGDCFDAVICANGFAAISLVRRLRRDDPARLKRLMVIGYQEVQLTRLYAQDILTVRLNFAEYGKAAVMLLENLRKNPYLRYMVMAIQWDLGALGAPGPAEAPSDPRSEAPVLAAPDDRFYEDPELNEMMLLEKLFYACEDADWAILHRLLNGDSYEKIAEECYFTVSTIKYRIKKMSALVELSGRTELLALLRRYLPAEPHA